MNLNDDDVNDDIVNTLCVLNKTKIIIFIQIEIKYEKLCISIESSQTGKKQTQ